MERDNVMEILEPALKADVRVVSHPDEVKVAVDAEGQVAIRPGRGQRSLPVLKDAIGNLTGFAGLPWGIAAQLHPATFANAATELLSQKKEFALVVQDNQVTDVVKNTHFHPVNAERVLRALEGSIPGCEYNSVRILQHMVVMLDLLGERREVVREGDLVQSGATVVFSPLGNVNPAVSSFVMRAWCSNGATSPFAGSVFEWGAGGGSSGGNSGNEGIFNWFRKSTRQAYNSLQKVVERYRTMTEEMVDPHDRALLLESLMRKAGITGEEAATVRSWAIEEPPENSYDIMNLITRASSHLIVDPKRILKARNAASEYAHSDEAHGRICPVCHARRN